jgi:hypothetical protein
VSIGTDLSFTRDLRCKFPYFDETTNNQNSQLFQIKDKKDQAVVENFRTKKTIDKESFKLVEKVQPKKSRTKYTKEQVECLKSAKKSGSCE